VLVFRLDHDERAVLQWAIDLYLDDRDLALFVRSSRMQQLRKEPAAQAKRDIEAAYGRDLAHGRIRITLVDATTIRFSETSRTGRHFQVMIRNGRISSQNLKPYGFVF
jgi:hypothetical protein